MTRDHRAIHEILWAPLIVFGFLVARFFPFETIGTALACPFKRLTSIPCVACGGTRAMIAFAHFDFWTAVTMNPLVAAGAGFGVLYVLHSLRVLVTKRPWRPNVPRHWALRLAVVGLVVLNWGYLIAAGR